MARSKIASHVALGAIALSALAALLLSPERTATAAAGDQYFCQLSQSQTQKAVAAFAKVSSVLTGQKRCFNCHGGVNPFGPDAGTTHGGGRRTPTMTECPPANGGYFVPGEVHSLCPEPSSPECQNCHSGLPGWKLAPPEARFVGRTAEQLCTFLKLNRHGDQLIHHITNDEGGPQFIETGFAGTRGLNGMGKGIVAAGANGDYQDEPILGSTHPQLIQDTTDWIHSLGPDAENTWPGAEGCGCTPYSYELHFIETGNINPGQVRCTIEGSLRVPLTIHDDMTISGRGTGTRNLHCGMAAATAKMGLATTVEVSGNVEVSGESATTLHVKTKWSSAGTGAVTGYGRTKSVGGGADGSAHASALDAFDLDLSPLTPKTITNPAPFQETVKVSVVQVTP